MTYNFDPDLWYENERSALEALLKSGEISKGEFELALSELEKRYDDMVFRLDGTYQIPD
jgi:hypothetical protein